MRSSSSVPARYGPHLFQLQIVATFKSHLVLTLAACVCGHFGKHK